MMDGSGGNPTYDVGKPWGGDHKGMNGGGALRRAHGHPQVPQGWVRKPRHFNRFRRILLSEEKREKREKSNKVERGVDGSCAWWCRNENQQRG